MILFGTLSRDGGIWYLITGDGEKRELVGGDLKPRMEGLTVRIVGEHHDDFAGDFFGGSDKVRVLRVHTR